MSRTKRKLPSFRNNGAREKKKTSHVLLLLSVFAFRLHIMSSLTHPQNDEEEGEEEDYINRMAREHCLDSGTVASPLILSPPPVSSNPRNQGEGMDQQDSVTTKWVSFGTASRYRGYLATPLVMDVQEKEISLPCLIVLHEWWGLNPQIQAVTRQLAQTLTCRAVLAVDLYGKDAATDVKTARKYMKECFKVKQEYCMDCLQQAVAYCQTDLNASSVGVIGWCLGGMFALELALAVPNDIRACVIFYGQLETDTERLACLQAPVLGIFGGADRGIPVASVHAFEQTLQTLEKRHEIHIYNGADHAFCNPTGNRYQEEPARDAWNKTLEFLQRYLK